MDANKETEISLLRDAWEIATEDERDFRLSDPEIEAIHAWHSDRIYGEPWFPVLTLSDAMRDVQDTINYLAEGNDEQDWRKAFNEMRPWGEEPFPTDAMSGPLRDVEEALATLPPEYTVMEMEDPLLDGDGTHLADGCIDGRCAMPHVYDDMV